MYQRLLEERGNQTNAALETVEARFRHDRTDIQIRDSLDKFAKSNGSESVNNKQFRGEMKTYLDGLDPKTKAVALQNTKSGILGLETPAPTFEENLKQSYKALGLEKGKITITGSSVTGKNSKGTVTSQNGNTSGHFRFQGPDPSDIDTQMHLTSEQYTQRNNQRSIGNNCKDPRSYGKGMIREEQLFETAHQKVENGKIVPIERPRKHEKINRPERNQALNDAAGREVTHSALDPDSIFNRDQHKFQDKKTAKGLFLAGGVLGGIQFVDGVTKLQEGHVLQGSVDVALGAGNAGTSVVGFLQDGGHLLKIAEKLGGVLCMIGGAAKVGMNINDLATKGDTHVGLASYNVVKGLGEVSIGGLLIEGSIGCLKAAAVVGGVITMIDGCLEIIDLAKSDDDTTTKLLKGAPTGMKVAGGALLTASAFASGTILGAPAGAVLAIAGGVLLAASAVANWIIMLFKKNGGVLLCYDGTENLDIKKFYNGPIEMDIKVFDQRPASMDLNQFIHNVFQMDIKQGELDIEPVYHGIEDMDIQPFRPGAFI